MTVRDNEPGMPDAPQERSSQTRSARRKPPPKDQPPRGDGGAPEQDASSADAALAPTRESSPIPAQWTISLGGPAHSSWREQALTRIADLRTRAEWFRASTEASAGADILTQAINGHLAAAQRAAEQPRSETGLRSVGIAFTGSEVERTMSNLEAAEGDLLRLAPPEYVRGHMPALVAYVRRHLPTGDPRRIRIEEAARRTERGDAADVDRDLVVSAFVGASAEARAEITRVRSFRNILLITAALLTLAATVVAIIGIADPDAIPLCFNPDKTIVCPTQQSAAGADLDKAIRATTSSWDLPLIEIIGLMAAAVAAAVALRNIRGTATPYSLPVALAVLKLPTGALTAFLGLLLMRGQFVPGLSNLDSSGQILAWAVVFGYAQQVFTRLVDAKAQSVLDDVGGSVTKASAG